MNKPLLAEQLVRVPERARGMVSRDALRRAATGRAAIVGVLAVVLGIAAATPPGDYLTRLGIDLLLPLRTWAQGPLFPPEASSVVVVAIDEQSYRTAPFSATPKVAWTPYLGRILEAIDGAGAKVIGVDDVFPTSLDQPDLLRGYDRPFLLSLAKVGRPGRLVLGEVRLSATSISPYRGQLLAAGAGNVRLLNLLLDEDEVVRRYPAAWPTSDGKQVTSFAAELARRAGATLPGRAFLVNYATGAAEVPTYSFADLWHCADKGDTDYFARHFKDKIVLVGEALDVEDRHIPASRFALQGVAKAPERCAVPVSNEFAPLVQRHTIPGVYIHAAAVNTIVKGISLDTIGFGAPLLICLQAAALGAVFFFGGPVLGALYAAIAALLDAAVALAAFLHGLVLPLLPLIAASALVYAGVYVYRFVVEGRERRRIRNAFRHYLAPVLVDRLANDPGALRLGGERRKITVFFSDIAGFTSISERMRETPERLVEVLNRYLTVMTSAIERNSGYVDKFIGDAVMAIWNAPLDDPSAERHAVEAALDCVAGLEKFNREVVVGEYGLPPIGTRIGLNTGIAIVGNMGSITRFNYTATGDMVNLASRLEGANKEYGTRIMISETTARGAGNDYLLRRLDRLVVKGKNIPVKVFEVVGRRSEVGAAAPEAVIRFHSALALYYRRRFRQAADAFAALAGTDPAAELYQERCEHYLEEPPPPDWNRAFVLKTK
ncbi:MAG TPA: adenylate/guanylate cyclase domain-containing protein [Candidatus Cybelea sp.]|nr:adenylate/guanylate cyclase domain-containing protein [Candidatus Cybelea sp.]